MYEVQAQTMGHLPVKFGENCIALLARDPNCLYVYWEITEETKNRFLQDFGQEFLGRSVPVLKVTNISASESFYVRINDFSNNWYINVPDPNSLYVVEIGRRISEHFFVSMLNSNCIVTPGNSLSPNTAAYFVNYADLKNGKPDIDEGKIYDSCITSYQSESIFGESSAQSYDIGLKG